MSLGSEENGFCYYLGETERTKEGGSNSVPQGPNQGSNITPGRDKTHKTTKKSTFLPNLRDNKEDGRRIDSFRTVSLAPPLYTQHCDTDTCKSTFFPCPFPYTPQLQLCSRQPWWTWASCIMVTSLKDNQFMIPFLKGASFLGYSPMKIWTSPVYPVYCQIVLQEIEKQREVLNDSLGS